MPKVTVNVCNTVNELFTTLIVPCSSYFFLYLIVGENEGDPLIGLGPNLYSRTISTILRLIIDKIRENEGFSSYDKFFCHTVYFQGRSVIFTF